MVKASMRVMHDVGTIELRVNGHAGFRELGKDPVCAGASVLAMTAAQCAEVLYDCGRLQKQPVVNVRDGHVRIVLKPKPERFREADLMMSTLAVGFHLLEESYPDHVSFKMVDAVPGDKWEKDRESGTESINTTESST